LCRSPQVLKCFIILSRRPWIIGDRRNSGRRFGSCFIRSNRDKRSAMHASTFVRPPRRFEFSAVCVHTVRGVIARCDHDDDCQRTRPVRAFVRSTRTRTARIRVLVWYLFESRPPSSWNALVYRFRVARIFTLRAAESVKNINIGGARYFVARTTA